MTPCAPSSPPEAVFVALGLGEELGGVVHRAAQAALAEEPGAWRLARAEGLHLTLFFAGRLPVEGRDALGAVLGRELGGLIAPGLVLRGTGAFPDRGRPRVLFVGLDPTVGMGALSDLVAGTRRAAGRAGVAAEALARSEGRPFRPHVTVARPRRSRTVSGVPSGFAGLDLELPFQPRDACLFASERGDGPARYRVLARMPLGG